MKSYSALVEALTEYEKQFSKGYRDDNITGYYPWGAEPFLESLLHIKNHLTLPPKPSFLDFGSGLGINVILAAKLGFNAYGIELHPPLVEEAKRIHQNMVDEGLLPSSAQCHFINGSYFPDDYMERRSEGRSFAAQLDEEGYCFPQKNPLGLFERNNLALDQIDVFFAYTYPEQTPSVYEIFALYAKPEAILLHITPFQDPQEDGLINQLKVSRHYVFPGDQPIRKPDELTLIRMNVESIPQ